MAAGKVAGVQALERQLSNAPTAGVVAFSSVSSIVAPLGQPNYASANASLCAWANAKAAQGMKEYNLLPSLQIKSCASGPDTHCEHGASDD